MNPFSHNVPPIPIQNSVQNQFGPPIEEDEQDFLAVYDPYTIYEDENLYNYSNNPPPEADPQNPPIPSNPQIPYVPNYTPYNPYGRINEDILWFSSAVDLKQVIQNQNLTDDFIIIPSNCINQLRMDQRRKPYPALLVKSLSTSSISMQTLHEIFYNIKHKNY